MIVNWRGLHGALGARAAETLSASGAISIYLILLLSALASLLKPIVFWRLPEWGGALPAARSAASLGDGRCGGIHFRISLRRLHPGLSHHGCLAWIKGLSFEEGELFRFAMRRFSYVLEWAGIVVVVSTLIVRLPLLLAYFMNVPRRPRLPADRAASS